MEQFFIGKVALVTGAASGIGHALALGFARYGADIFVADINSEGIEQTKHEIESLGRHAYAIPLNVQKYDECVRAAQTVKEKFGHLDILINNAGYSRLYPLLHPKNSVEVIDNILKTNTLGVAYLTHTMLPLMTEKGGTVLTTGSTVIYNPNAGWTMYSMSKSALVGFTECLAMEVEKFKITVNLIMPSMVRTPLLRGMNEDLINSMNPMLPEELVDYFAFFATEDAKKVTGAKVNVDLVKEILAIAKNVPETERTWAGIKEKVEASIKPEQYKEIRQVRKLIDFLLRPK